MGVATVADLKTSISGKRSFRPNSSARHVTEWYAFFFKTCSLFFDANFHVDWKFICGKLGVFDICCLCTLYRE